MHDLSSMTGRGSTLPPSDYVSRRPGPKSSTAFEDATHTIVDPRISRFEPWPGSFWNPQSMVRGLR